MNYCLACARAGDPDALKNVVDTLRPRLAKMAAYYARCAHENPDDLLQEAWLGLLEALPDVDTEIGSPEQYLIQRARWRLLDAVRREHVRRCVPLDEAMGEPLPLDERFCAFDQVSIAVFADSLKESQQAILSRLLDGFTWREAGDALGCTSANIAYHVRQIQRQYELWNAETV